MVFHIYESKFGDIQICINGKYIVNMTMKKEEFKSLKYMTESNKKSTIIEKDLLDELIIQLDEYFSKKRITFDLPIEFKCTQFQKNVYEAVLKTSYGKTYSYKEIAELAKFPRAYRAVGTAMKNNPYAIIIPCHRVIKANGNYGKYFDNDFLKEALINFEKEV